MNATATTRAIAAIAALDLACIKAKLMHVPSGEGWTVAYADRVETEYRRFLTLMKLFPNELAAPLVDVDIFWHYHILDTVKYAADCAAALGYFLHHDPSLGMAGDASLAERDRAGARLQERYAATFGAALPALPEAMAWCGATTARPVPSKMAWCGATTGQPLEAAVAWCSATTGRPLEAAVAWCGATTAQPAGQTLAWCGATTAQPAVQRLAWCGASVAAPVERALAWCGAARPVTVQVGPDIVLSVDHAA